MQMGDFRPKMKKIGTAREEGSVRSTIIAVFQTQIKTTF
jgi:hypothetical protein